MLKFCPGCGGGLNAQSKFCPACGRVLDVPRAHAPNARHQIDHRSHSGRDMKPVLVGTSAAVAVLAIAAVSAWYVGWLDPHWQNAAQTGVDRADEAEGAVSTRPASWFKTYSDSFLSPESTIQYVTGPAQKRDFPTSKGSTSLATLQPGERLTGRWVEGADPPPNGSRRLMAVMSGKAISQVRVSSHLRVCSGWRRTCPTSKSPSMSRRLVITKVHSPAARFIQPWMVR